VLADYKTNQRLKQLERDATHEQRERILWRIAAGAKRDAVDQATAQDVVNGAQQRNAVDDEEHDSDDDDDDEFFREFRAKRLTGESVLFWFFSLWFRLVFSRCQCRLSVLRPSFRGR
jgi:hypothetical protein